MGDKKKPIKIGFWERFSMKLRLSPGPGDFHVKENSKKYINFGTRMFVPKFGLFWGSVLGPKKDAAFLLTIGSFLLPVELFYLQLTVLACLLTIGAFLLTILAFFCLQVEFFAYNGKVRRIRALRDCKQRSLTVTKKLQL